MEISWLGHSCFMLRGKNVTLITDPYSPQPEHPQGEMQKVREGKINAPIVTISHNHPGHNFVEGIRGNNGNLRVVRGPGEYEISDVLITGVPSYHDAKRGAERGRNTIYIIHMDDLVICHLGDLGHILQEEQLEEVADADILLIPISGSNTLSAAQAAEVISQVEPHVVIPMHYRPSTGTGEGPDPLDKFCREMGIEAVNVQPKLTILRSSLPVETQVVILSQR
jgi:L-ascorbate metabolism protein UlaG (beta-lactamase superfamily)